jgi:glycerol-3-phosphate acyltransferase PlsY
LGTLLGLNPLGGFLTFATWVLVVLTTKYVGLSSVVAVFLCGVYFWLYGSSLPYICYCVAGFLFVAYRHKANFARMMKGTEPKLGDRPKEPEVKQESPLPGA